MLITTFMAAEDRKMKQIFADTSYWIGLVNPGPDSSKVMKITQRLHFR
jgi:hypothetical protein